MSQKEWSSEINQLRNEICSDQYLYKQILIRKKNRY